MDWRERVGGVPFPVMVDYEYQRLTLPRGTSRNTAQRLLTDAAEQGHWELDRLRLYPDGTRKVVLRRRYLRVKPTLDRELISR